MKQLRHFFAEEYDRLVKKANARVRHFDDAEDIVMDAFRKAVEYWNSYDPSHKEIGAWFNTILNNSIKTYQREKFIQHVEIDDVEDDTQELSDEGKELYSKVIDSMYDKGDDNRRQILYLFYVLGYSYKEIDQIQDTSMRNIRYYIEDFRMNMRTRFGEEYENMYR